MGLYLHPLLHGRRAGGDKPVAALHLHNAHAAGACRRELCHAAERGYHYAVTVKRREDGLSLLRLYALVIYFYRELHGLFYCDGTELTYIITYSAADAFIVNDEERLQPCSVDGIDRAFGRADRTAGAFIHINAECPEPAADIGAAAPVEDMLLELLTVVVRALMNGLGAV